MSDKEAIDLELAKERVERRKEALAELAPPMSPRPVDVIVVAEKSAMLALLVDAGVCTETDYNIALAEELDNMISMLVDNGDLDTTALVLDEEAEDAA